MTAPMQAAPSVTQQMSVVSSAPPTPVGVSTRVATAAHTGSSLSPCTASFLFSAASASTSASSGVASASTTSAMVSAAPLPTGADKKRLLLHGIDAQYLPTFLSSRCHSSINGNMIRVARAQIDAPSCDFGVLMGALMLIYDRTRRIQDTDEDWDRAANAKGLFLRLVRALSDDRQRLLAKLFIETKFDQLSNAGDLMSSLTVWIDSGLQPIRETFLRHIGLVYATFAAFDFPKIPDSLASPAQRLQWECSIQLQLEGAIKQVFHQGEIPLTLAYRGYLNSAGHKTQGGVYDSVWRRVVGEPIFAGLEKGGATGTTLAEQVFASLRPCV